MPKCRYRAKEEGGIMLTGKCLVGLTQRSRLQEATRHLMTRLTECLSLGL